MISNRNLPLVSTLGTLSVYKDAHVHPPHLASSWFSFYLKGITLTQAVLATKD